MTTTSLVPPTALQTADALNTKCHCRTLDEDLLRRHLDGDANLAGLTDTLWRTRPHLFSSTAVFVSADIREAIETAVAAIEQVIRLPAYRTSALSRAPAIAGRTFGPHGVFVSYDFHLRPEGPRLIEVNTNAGGALLNLALAGAQHACCEAMNWVFVARDEAPPDERTFVDMFRREWQLQRDHAAFGRLLIIDDDPASQYLAGEFELFRRMFERFGIEAAVADAAELEWRGGALRHDGVKVSMVYNRLTDFYLSEPRHAALRDAYEAGAVVLTPHPHAHALHADKRNLVTLSNDELLASWGVAPEERRVIGRTVPQTRLVSAENAADLWAERRNLFFKPVGGYGAKAAYRGDKLTRRVWGEIWSGLYVAQALVPPAERLIELDGALVDLKFDLRAYTYNGEVQLLAARMYAGQTTNFRTPGGGFAPVIVVP